MSRYEKLSEKQLDALREILSIGAGNSATALSQIMEKKIGMSVPAIKILPFSQVPDAVGGAEKVVAGVFLSMEGQTKGSLLLVFPIESAKILAGHLMETTYGAEEEIDMMGKSALCEVGNVLSGAFLNALSDFTNLDFIPSIPALAIDMVGALLDSVLATVGLAEDRALLMETVFSEIEQNVTGQFFLLPEEGSLDKILEAIGVMR